MAYTIKVNAVDHSVDVDGDTPLLWVLRDVLGMTGTKFGCGKALCGACTVLINDIATRSCITTIDSVGTAAITTIEAIGNTPNGKKIQKAWLDLEVVQCGYCQSGQIMSASALLASKPNPSDADIDDAMAGNHLPLRHLRPDSRSHQAGCAVHRHQWTERLSMFPDRLGSSAADSAAEASCERNLSRRTFLAAVPLPGAGCC